MSANPELNTPLQIEMAICPAIDSFLWTLAIVNEQNLLLRGPNETIFWNEGKSLDQNAPFDLQNGIDVRLCDLLPHRGKHQLLRLGFVVIETVFCKYSGHGGFA